MRPVRALRIQARVREAAIGIFAWGRIDPRIVGGFSGTGRLRGGTIVKPARLPAFRGHRFLGPCGGCARRDQADVFERRLGGSTPLDAFLRAAEFG